MVEETKVFAARKIITMNPNCPAATHIAVRAGRVLAVGTLEDMEKWGSYTLDERFRDKILMPGFVEGHAHAIEGMVWGKCHYVGFFPRRAPDGRLANGLKSIEAVVEHLRAVDAEMANPEEPLYAWGFDPIYFGGQRMTRHDLDRVSRNRPVLVIHASFHLLNVNSTVLQRANITRETEVEGVMKDAGGEPNGELQEMAAKFMAFRVAGRNPLTDPAQPDDLWRFANAARVAGVTTITDLHSKLDDETVSCYRTVTAEEGFPARVVPAIGALAWEPEAGVAHIRKLRELGNEKLYLGLVKIMTDGSIQGFTARMKWPGYFNGAPNGMWNIPPSEIKHIIRLYHEAGCQIHIHTNGDQASELVIEAIDEALQAAPRLDHRHTLQHCQMADAAQFRRMKALGICANLFANHLFYWGDQHYTLTMGPDRAMRMDAAATALREGVPLAIHSDAPVTPLGPLFTAWCAVNRRTASGRALGEAERITVEQALHAITLGAAYTLKLDHLVGSIEIGKFADFAVLEDDPLAVAPEALKDVPVWGTVVAGACYPVAE
jgi:predicted amidohydrolase YtcJ